MTAPDTITVPRGQWERMLEAVAAFDRFAESVDADATNTTLDVVRLRRRYRNVIDVSRQHVDASDARKLLDRLGQ